MSVCLQIFWNPITWEHFVCIWLLMETFSAVFASKLRKLIVVYMPHHCGSTSDPPPSILAQLHQSQHINKIVYYCFLLFGLFYWIYYFPIISGGMYRFPLSSASHLYDILFSSKTWLAPWHVSNLKPPSLCCYSFGRGKEIMENIQFSYSTLSVLLYSKTFSFISVTSFWLPR